MRNQMARDTLSRDIRAKVGKRDGSRSRRPFGVLSKTSLDRHRPDQRQSATHLGKGQQFQQCMTGLQSTMMDHDRQLLIIVHRESTGRILPS